MKTYIDIHSHSKTHKSHVFELINLILPDIQTQKDEYYSAAWHPWHLKNYALKNMECELQKLNCSKNIIAIGECGIDRAINVSIEFQKQVFMLHLSIAEQLNKPVIIHAVRSISDILEILKVKHFKQVIIFHDFRGNKEEIKQLERFNTYFSFGRSLFQSNKKVLNSFNSIDASRIFFETDASEILIEKIYLRASNLLKMDLINLQKQIQNNFTSVFGDELAE